jgi:hypothetical protein
MANSFMDQYKAARRASTPLMAISTPDPSATISNILRATPAKDGKETVPFIRWDVINGWVGLNDLGCKTIEELLRNNDAEQDQTKNPVEHLIMAGKLPELSVLFILNAQRFFDSVGFIQALWNLRDEFEFNVRTAVLLGPDFTLPPELAQDVLALDEPLPSPEQLKESILCMARANDVAGAITEDMLARGTDALRGLAAYPAKQATAMSMTREGLNVTSLWERKRQLINSTPGLSIFIPKKDDPQTFDDLGGLDQLKGFLRRVINGRKPPRLVVFIDEIEKALAGATGTGDSSGVSQGQHERLLTEMQNQHYNGLFVLGHPGGGKSAIAKVFGAEARVPTITLDLNGMKGSLVGESDQRLRRAMKVIETVGDGSAFFIATCNQFSSLSTELKRRFKAGTFFVDLPSREEQEAIWAIYLKRYELDPAELTLFDWTDWTGAEIENVCERAWSFNCSLKEASQYVVPICRSAAESIAELRRQAKGRFLSASKEGVYAMDNAALRPPSERRLQIDA